MSSWELHTLIALGIADLVMLFVLFGIGIYLEARDAWWRGSR